MSKSNSAPEPSASNSTQQDAGGIAGVSWTASRKTVVSAIIVFHFFAIITAASSVPPTSDLIVATHRLVAPYLHAMYMNHGYRFFAPQPGPCHIVRYETESGGAGQFPDRHRIWPRLRYHRWFMLSETVFNEANRFLNDTQLTQWSQQVGQDAGRLRSAGNLRGAMELEVDFKRAWDQQLELNRMVRELCKAVAKVLADQEGQGVRVVKSVTRNLPAPQDVANGLRLDDPVLTPVEEQIDLHTFERGVAPHREEIQPGAQR